jgi:DnaK suppressor protein
MAHPATKSRQATQAGQVPPVQPDPGAGAAQQEQARQQAIDEKIDEKLKALKQRLYEDVDKLAKVDDDRTPYGGDFESLVAAAQLASQYETDELLRRRLQRRLQELDRVDQRLKQGEYGKCEACGAQIPEERLAAKPDTTLCVSCQRQRERRGAWRRAA